MELGVGRRLRQPAHRRAQPAPRCGGQRGQDGCRRLVRVGQRLRRVRRLHQALEQIDVALRVEVREQLLPELVDLAFEQLQEGCRRPLVAGRERLRALSQPFQQHLAIAHGAQAHREPTELGSQRLGPLRIEERSERAQVGPQLARRDPRLVHSLRVATGPDQRVVMEKRGDRLRDGVLDQVLRRRVGCQRLRRDFGRLDRPRTEGPDVLRGRVGCSGARAAQPRHERRDDALGGVGALGAVGARHLDLDLAESRGDAPAVAHRNLVVHHLGDTCPGGVDQADAAPHRR